MGETYEQMIERHAKEVSDWQKKQQEAYSAAFAKNYTFVPYPSLDSALGHDR